MKVKKSSIPEKEKVYNRILRFATIRPRSEKEIKFWFQRKRVYPELAEGVFNRLKSIGLVDDVLFAKWWIDQRLTFRPKSRRALSIELRQKGVEREIISQALEAVNDKSVAATLARGRLARLTHLPVEVRQKKLSDFLARRGFSWDVVKEVLDPKHNLE